VNQTRNRPLGPNGTWKTGQRCPSTGNWRDQYGQVIAIERHDTFPPCVGRKGECAYRSRVREASTAA
jgi:hypothetical protein